MHRPLATPVLRCVSDTPAQKAASPTLDPAITLQPHACCLHPPGLTLEKPPHGSTDSEDLPCASHGLRLIERAAVRMELRTDAMLTGQSIEGEDGKIAVEL